MTGENLSEFSRELVLSSAISKLCGSAIRNCVVLLKWRTITERRAVTEKPKIFSPTATCKDLLWTLSSEYVRELVYEGQCYQRCMDVDLLKQRCMDVDLLKQLIYCLLNKYNSTEIVNQYK